MRTSRDANKYSSNKSSGVYHGNGFIPSRQSPQVQGTPILVILVLGVVILCGAVFLASMVI